MLVSAVYALAVINFGTAKQDESFTANDLSNADISLTAKIISQSLDGDGYYLAYTLPELVEDGGNYTLNLKRATSTFSASEFEDCQGTKGECIDELKRIVSLRVKANKTDRRVEIVRQRESVNVKSGWSGVSLGDISITEGDIND